MKWRCALIQRRLPDYPDGDLSPFWKRLVAVHLEVCPDCRQEWEEMVEALRLYQAHPLSDPGPAFWQEFQQELHLKLAQVNQIKEPAPQRLRLPHYLLGATAMAGILALAVYLGPFSRPSLTPQMAARQGNAKAPQLSSPQESPRGKMAGTPATAAPSPGATRVAETTAARSEALEAQVAKPEAPPSGEPQYSLAAGKLEGRPQAVPEDAELLAEDDDLDWDVDSVVADLSREEQQNLKIRLESRR